MTVLISILGCLANIGLVLLVAPLFEGMARKLTALAQSRRGPPLWQPYFDLLKLLGKEDLESGESPFLQRWSVYLGLASILTVACLVPMGFAAPLQQAGDVILLIYLLTLCGICTLMAGLAAGSTYALVGISREMMAMIALEPLFAAALLVAAMHNGSVRLDAVFHGAVYASGEVPWSGLLMLGAVVLSFPALVQRLPFDTAEAETELMEGPLMEYSGPKLALAKYAHMAKVVVYSGLFVALFVPWGASLAWPWSWLCFWLKVLAVVLCLTAIAATHARYRIDQALHHYASLLGVALVALVLTSLGY